MDLYIDKGNINSFIAQCDHILFNDCMKTLKKQLNVKFNFSKDELLTDNDLMLWFNNFASGVGENNTQTFNEVVFPNRPLKSNSYLEFDAQQLSAIYLISDDRLSVLKDKGAVLVGGPGEEIEIFNQIFFLQSDYSFDKKFRIGSAEFKKWQDLLSCSSAVTDIIFIDNFILSDPTRFNDNLFPLLQTLVSKARCKVNLLLYVNRDSVSISYDDLSPLIRKTIKDVTGVSPSFTLVQVRDQRNVESYAEHDRTIFSNYYRIYSGDTFNYFKSDGSKLTKGREIHYSSFGDSKNHSLALELLADIQKNLNELSSDVVEGDKQSNFLNFK